MLNIRFLRTLVAISQYPTFVAAGEAIGLSHSAVSVHVKALEEQLGVSLVDRSKRPPALTDKGVALVDYASRILSLVDDIKGLANEQTLIGSLRIGVVPSALTNLLPPALALLRQIHSKLHITVRSGLSADLLQCLRNREIDVAILTDPPTQVPGLRIHEIAQEPIVLIAPSAASEATPEELFATHPFIWFDRLSWAGQQIERYLQSKRYALNPVMEVTALESIESFVRHGLGISVVPHAVLSGGFGARIRTLPLGKNGLYRRLVMVELASNPRAVLTGVLKDQIDTCLAPRNDTPLTP